MARKKVLALDPETRATFAKALVAETAPEPERVLSQFDRDIIGALSVQLRLPLRNPKECKAHLQMLAEVATDLAGELTGSDRSQLFRVRRAFRMLDMKMNAYKRQRRE